MPTSGSVIGAEGSSTALPMTGRASGPRHHGPPRAAALVGGCGERHALGYLSPLDLAVWGDCPSASSPRCQATSMGGTACAGRRGLRPKTEPVTGPDNGGTATSAGCGTTG